MRRRSGTNSTATGLKSNSSAPGTYAVAVCLAGFFLLYTAGCSRDPVVRAEKSYQRAEKYLQENNPDAAVIELRRALQLNPQLAKAHFALGNVELQRGATLTAFQEFFAATVADPDNRQAQIMVAELLARAHNFTQAKRQAELVLSRWPDDKTATLLLAESEIGLQDIKRGSTLVNEVLAVDPNNVRALQDLALLQLAQKSFPQAEATLRQAWLLDPKSASAVALLSAIYEGQGDLPTAESVLQQALRQNANDVTFQSLLAAFYMRHKRFSDAEPLYRRIQESAKNQPQSPYHDVLAQFYLSASRLDDALAEYKRLVQADPKDWRSWHGVAVVYLVQGHYEEAIGVLDQVLKNNPKDWEGLALKGRILLDRGQTADAIPSLQQSRKLRPEAAEPAFDLARAYASQGKLGESQSALQDVMKINPKYPGALVLLAALNLEGGRVDQAIQNLSEDQLREPATVERSFLLSQAYAAKGEYHAAESQLQGILGSVGPAPQKSVILQSLASIKLAQKQYAEAATMANAALDASPQLPTALYVLGMSYVGQKQPEKGVEAVKARLQKVPDWVPGVEVLGRVAQQAGQLSVATDAFNKALSLSPKLTSARLELGDTYWMNKQPDLARQQFEKVAQQQDATGRSYALCRLGQIYEAEGDFEKARVSYEKALAADRDNVLAKNNLAWNYAEHGGNLDVALRLAEEAKEKAPDDPTITDTLGWIYVKTGSYEAAVANLKISVAGNPHDPAGLYHLGTAYYKLGKTADAKRELEAALKMPNFSQAADARRMLADMPPK
jgi:tetratricopeptide (TPR) repeat protein